MNTRSRSSRVKLWRDSHSALPTFRGIARNQLLHGCALLLVVALAASCGKSSRDPAREVNTHAATAVVEEAPVHEPTPAVEIAAVDAMFDEAAFTGQLRAALALAGAPHQRWQELSEIARALPPTHFAAALAAAEKVLPRQEWQTFRSVVLARWAAEDLSAALAYAHALTEPRDRQQALTTVLQVWARSDAPATLNWVAQIPDEALRLSLSRTLLLSLLNSSPQLVADNLRLLAPAQQAELARMLAAQWAAHDFDAALSWARALPDDTVREAALTSLCALWATKDLSAATEFARALPEGDLRDKLFADLANALVLNDPKTTAGLVGTISSGTKRQQLMDRVVSTWASRDPNAAATFAMTLPEGENRNVILKHLTSIWAASDPKAAVAWAHALPEGNTRAGALSSALGRWAATSREEATAYAMELTGDDQIRSIRSIVWTMAMTDPAAAGAWVEQFPEGQIRDLSMERLVKTWAGADPKAASEWMTSQPAGAGRDLAASQFVEVAGRQAPQLAWQWAVSISDSLQRAMAVESAARAWFSQDPDAARLAVQSSNLPSDQKERLLRPY